MVYTLNPENTELICWMQGLVRAQSDGCRGFFLHNRLFGKNYIQPKIFLCHWTHWNSHLVQVVPINHTMFPFMCDNLATLQYDQVLVISPIQSNLLLQVCIEVDFTVIGLLFLRIDTKALFQNKILAFANEAGIALGVQMLMAKKCQTCFKYSNGYIGGLCYDQVLPGNFEI